MVADWPPTRENMWLTCGFSHGPVERGMPGPTLSCPAGTGLQRLAVPNTCRRLGCRIHAPDGGHGWPSPSPFARRSPSVPDVALGELLLLACPPMTRFRYAHLAPDAHHGGSVRHWRHSGSRHGQ